MKRTAYLFAITLLVFAGCRSNGAAKPLSRLREIKIESHTLLNLGGKMPPTSDFCIWRGTTCTLKPGTFGGTEGMSLGTTEAGSISDFHFYYGAMTTDAVNAQIDDYARLLGKPSGDSHVKAGDVDTRIIRWSDTATTLELSYKSTPNQVEASAAIFDNALAKSLH
jgi:hypothetical protein